MALSHTQRKGLLLAKGQTAKKIAADLGHSRGLVSGVIAGSYGHRSDKVRDVEARICQLVGLSHDVVFGSSDDVIRGAVTADAIGGGGR